MNGTRIQQTADAYYQTRSKEALEAAAAAAAAVAGEEDEFDD